MKILLIGLLIIISVLPNYLLANSEYTKKLDSNRCAGQLPQKCTELAQRFSALTKPKFVTYREIYQSAQWVFQSDDLTGINIEYRPNLTNEYLASTFEIDAESCTQINKISMRRMEKTSRTAWFVEQPHITVQMSQGNCEQFTVNILDRAGRPKVLTEADCVYQKSQVEKFGPNFFDACYAVWGINLVYISNLTTNDCIDCSISYQQWSADVTNIIDQLAKTFDYDLIERTRENEISNDIYFQRELPLLRQSLEDTIEPNFFSDLLMRLKTKLPQEEIYRMLLEYGNRPRDPRLTTIWINMLSDLLYSPTNLLGHPAAARYTTRRNEILRSINTQIDRTNLTHEESSALAGILLLKMEKEKSAQDFHLQQEKFSKLISHMTPLKTFESAGAVEEIVYFIRSNFLNSVTTDELNRRAIINILNQADNVKHNWILRKHINDELFEYNILEYMQNPTPATLRAIVKSGKVIKQAPTNDELKAQIEQFKIA